MAASPRVQRLCPGLDVVRVQDVGLLGADDPAILEWTAGAGRVVVTHDAATMLAYAYARVNAALAMPGVLLVRGAMSIGQAIEEILMVVECCTEQECENQVMFLPL